METEKNEEGGSPRKVTRPIIIETPADLSLSHPVLCRRCQSEYTIQEDGPDAGELFACGIMVENIEAGNMAFSCPYFKSVPTVVVHVGDKLICKSDNHLCLCQPEGCGSCGKIIDSDTANAAISLRAKADAIEPGFDARAYLEEIRI